MGCTRLSRGGRGVAVGLAWRQSCALDAGAGVMADGAGAGRRYRAWAPPPEHILARRCHNAAGQATPATHQGLGLSQSPPQNPWHSRGGTPAPRLTIL
ncbi:hypothetical protein [Cyanobium usitatum]|uniref:hypothetical protein n=1 Tax=Cyanobium usitatum TaxID=2304190 RepID=UPI002AD36B16|nr:hypothetical protein [Cyanobium usitatum]